jgi:hypothetical protein
MSSITELITGRTLIVMPWHDLTVEQHGYDPRGRYAELFVLPVLGPTATWLLRRLVDGLETYADGYELDLAETASALGLSLVPDRSGPFSRAFHRCVMFGYAQPVAYGVAVRRLVGTLLPRQLDRLPPHLRQLHADFVRRPSPDELSRATSCADALLRAGQHPNDLERMLLGLGHRASVAAHAARAARLNRSALAPA